MKLRRKTHTERLIAKLARTVERDLFSNMEPDWLFNQWRDGLRCVSVSMNQDEVVVRLQRDSSFRVVHYIEGQFDVQD